MAYPIMPFDVGVKNLILLYDVMVSMELFESSRLCSSQSGAANFGIGVEGHTVVSFRLAHES